MKRYFFLFSFIFLFISSMSCNVAPVAHSFKKADNRTIPSESKKIDEKKNQKLSSMLYHLALSPNPVYFAKRHDIPLDNHRVKVYIFLEPSSPEPERMKLLKVHNIVIEKRSTDMLRGLAPVDQLIPLSEEPAVRFIRLPDKLIKTRKIRS